MDTTHDGRELRLALGIRGGVSLAVWIGGASAEIDRLRRNSEAPEGLWSQLSELGGYDGVAVDVLAGASAGGLNGVLYAGSQVYGGRFDLVRGTWLKLGGTETMVRRNAPWPSLFHGDDQLLDGVHSALEELVAQKPPSQRQRIDLRLPVTLVEPISRPAPSPADEDLHESRSAGSFHFRVPDETWLATDLPQEDGARDKALWRLAQAARATSSFPAAFEAAVVRSARPSGFGAQVEDGDTGRTVDMNGTFDDRSAADPTFVLADGGVFDNIPLGRALDAIAAAPAERPTRRVLLYLQPGAPAARRSGGAEIRPQANLAQEHIRRSTTSVLRGIKTARISDETIARDVAQLEAQNEAIERASSTRRGAFLELCDTDRLRKAAAAARGSYIEQRADGDARLIRDLLTDPVGVLGQDPFPASVARTEVPDDQWRSPLVRWTPLARERLVEELRSVFRERFTKPSSDLPSQAGSTGSGDDEAQAASARAELVDVLLSGTRPVRRVTQLLLDWARYLELQRAQVGSVKAVLYRTLEFIEVTLERPRRLAWVAAAAADVKLTALDDAATRFAGLTKWVESMCSIESAKADAIAVALESGEAGPLEDARRQLSEQVETAVAGYLSQLDPDGAVGTDPATSSDHVDLRHTIIDRVLVSLAERLRKARTDAGLTGAEDRRDHPGGWLDRALAADTVTVDTLGALEIVCYREFVVGLPCRRRIEFARLSAGNPTPIAHAFTSLLPEDHEGAEAWWDPDERRRDHQRGISLDRKLAGNELGNFSAFLRPEWRANDWMWGRLDAVPTLVDALLEPARLRALLSAGDVETAVTRIQSIVSPADHPLHVLLEEEWQPRRDPVRDEITDLLSDTASGARNSLRATRDAIVARRQWEIVAEELALPSGDRVSGAPSPELCVAESLDAPGTRWLPSEDAKKRVAEHREGIETPRRPWDASMRSQIRLLTKAAARTASWNLSKDGGGPLPAKGIRALLRPHLLAVGVRFAIRRALRPQKSVEPGRARMG